MRRRRFSRCRAGVLSLLLLVGVGICLLTVLMLLPPPPLIRGVFWQFSVGASQPKGHWNLIGCNTLVVQWSAADGRVWYPSCDLRSWAPAPNWRRISSEPWARRIIVGLAGDYSETQARGEVDYLLRLSQLLAYRLPVPPAGYYFPVEADPTWQGVGQLAAAATLPRPLWISIYSNNGSLDGRALAEWLKSWLPEDTNIFFQDGVGLGIRSPARARGIVKQLQAAFGAQRIAVVAELFRLDANHSSRPASLLEVADQLDRYAGLQVYAFPGPRPLGAWSALLLNIRWRLLHSNGRVARLFRLLAGRT